MGTENRDGGSVLPSPLVAGANNALSFVLTGWGPFNFELWGTNTPSPCMAEELLWWGPFGAGTQCAQFKPRKAVLGRRTGHVGHDRRSRAGSLASVTPGTSCAVCKRDVT